MQALIIVVHGSYLNSDSNTPTYNHAGTVRKAGASGEVRIGFWKEEPSIREMPQTVEADKAYVVPLFISEDYFTEQIVPREFHLGGWDTADWGSDSLPTSHVTLTVGDVPERMIHYCGPVGTHAAIIEVLVRRAKTITGDSNVGEGFGLAAIGRGTEHSENSAKATRYHADRIREMDRSDEMQALHMGEESEVGDATDYFDPENVVIIPLFIADGFHTQEDIPEDMGLTGDYRTGYDMPAEAEGHRIWCVGAVDAERLMVDVIPERVANAGVDTGNGLEVVRERTRRALQEVN